MQTPFFLSTIVTVAKTNPVLGTLPKGCDIEDVAIHVLTAFDNSVSLEVGYDSDHDAYGVSQSVTTVGRKKPTLGAGIGLDTTARQAKVYMTNTPTVGEAIVVIDGKILMPTI